MYPKNQGTPKTTSLIYRHLGAVYMSPTGRAGPARRDPACYMKSIFKKFSVYMRGGPALPGEISLLTTQDLAR